MVSTQLLREREREREEEREIKGEGVRKVCVREIKK
jgi:hypothetical protein